MSTSAPAWVDYGDAKRTLTHAVLYTACRRCGFWRHDAFGFFHKIKPIEHPISRTVNPVCGGTLCPHYTEITIQPEAFQLAWRRMVPAGCFITSLGYRAIRTSVEFGEYEPVLEVPERAEKRPDWYDGKKPRTYGRKASGVAPWIREARERRAGEQGEEAPGLLPKYRNVAPWVRKARIANAS